MGHVTAIGGDHRRGARARATAAARPVRWEDHHEPARTRRPGMTGTGVGARPAGRRRRRQPLRLPGPRGTPARSSPSSASRRSSGSCPPTGRPTTCSATPKRRRGRGIRVIVAGAGGAAHLPGMLAAKTILPVIGVPIPTQHLGGMDSLLSIVQMPRGIPVATVAIGNATNAGLLAAQILAARRRGARRRASRRGGRAQTRRSSTIPRTPAARAPAAPASRRSGRTRPRARCSARWKPRSRTVLSATRMATAAAGAP